MLRLNLGRVAVLFLAFISITMVWCGESANAGPATNVVNSLELELVKKQAVEREKWKSQGVVSKSEVIGGYQYWPFDRKAFRLNADGTGELFGGANGVGTWPMMWEFDEKEQMLAFQSKQVRRMYKAIKKDGKVWFIEGRELWRQGANSNQLLKWPMDKAQKSN